MAASESVLVEEAALLAVAGGGAANQERYGMDAIVCSCIRWSRTSSEPCWTTARAVPAQVGHHAADLGRAVTPV